MSRSCKQADQPHTIVSYSQTFAYKQVISSWINACSTVTKLYVVWNSYVQVSLRQHTKQYSWQTQTDKDWQTNRQTQTDLQTNTQKDKTGRHGQMDEWVDRQADRQREAGWTVNVLTKYLGDFYRKHSCLHTSGDENPKMKDRSHKEVAEWHVDVSVSPVTVHAEPQ